MEPTAAPPPFFTVNRSTLAEMAFGLDCLLDGSDAKIHGLALLHLLRGELILSELVECVTSDDMDLDVFEERRLELTHVTEFMRITQCPESFRQEYATFLSTVTKVSSAAHELAVARDCLRKSRSRPFEFFPGAIQAAEVLAEMSEIDAKNERNNSSMMTYLCLSAKYKEIALEYLRKITNLATLVVRYIASVRTPEDTSALSIALTHISVICHHEPNTAEAEVFRACLRDFGIGLETERTPENQLTLNFIQRDVEIILNR